MKTVTFNLDPLKQQTNTLSSSNIKLTHARPTMQYIPLVYENSTVQLARVGPARSGLPQLYMPQGNNQMAHSRCLKF